MGKKIGEKGLDRYASKKRLDAIRRRVKDSGAFALAALELIPPPFSFTLFVFPRGALKVKPATFFVTLGVCRLLRFGLEAWLAVVYGRRFIPWIDPHTLHDILRVFHLSH